ncbi:NADH-quinone oxidoreductase subunit J [soil metagenome]
MPIEQIIFYAFSTILIAAGLLMIVCRNPVYAALFLVVAFFASGSLWLLLEAEFLALVLVLVYVGAVMTLFLFVVMMLNIDLAPLREGFVRYLPLGIFIVALMIGLLVYVIKTSSFNLAHYPMPTPQPASYSNISELGKVLYTDYVYPFELAAFLLLVAIIAAISLNLRGPRSKVQRGTAQVEVKRADRVHLIKMASEQKK